MNRRAFLEAMVGGLGTGLGAGEAQQLGKLWRIGIIGYTLPTADMVGPDPKNIYIGAFLRGLRELGYVYGRNYVTETRGAEAKTERFPRLVAELVSRKVDVIVAVAASLPALTHATSTIPIVMAGYSDPVRFGYAESLSRPGANITGLTNQWLELVGKRLELLKQLVPTAAPVAVLWDRPPNYAVWEAAEDAARRQGWKLLSLPIRDAGEIEDALKMATSAQAGALLAAAALALDPHPERVVALAAKNRIPAMYHQRYYVELGGLVSYAPDLGETWRRAATFVDKILKGARPGDLPIEQPTQFELVINMKTANTLGLTIPPSLLLRADQVIE
jgi:putative ABC transport system substrate-binding protein